MKNIFISHASDDSAVAMRIAGELERNGYSTWYYERDSLPGISHLEQCKDAIKMCDSFLLLISQRSLESHEVTTELYQAHQGKAEILPVRLKVSHGMVQTRKPEWNMIIGTRVSIELRSKDPTAIVSKLVDSLRHLRIEPALADTGRCETADSKSGGDDFEGQRWASDANQIDIRYLDRLVFTNEGIEDFLQSRGKFFLSANKGLGKTLLLTYKRMLFEDPRRESKQTEPSNIIFVPQGRPYLDFMSDLHSLDKKHVDFLQSLANTKRLWTLALLVSALSHHPSLLKDLEEDDLNFFSKEARKWLLGAKIEPTVVFRELLAQSVSNINRLHSQIEGLLERRFRHIHRGTFLFLDKVDQAVKHLPRSAWISVQAGLLEAAWDLMNANRHVRIYATIRQEAFSNYESDIKANLYGATTILQYSRDELCALLDQLSECYEAGRAFKQFIDLNVVKAPPRACPEDSFDFLHRHTLGRPRDLVIICSSLSRNRRSLDEPLYRQLVIDTSAAALAPNIFKEMQVFLESLHNDEERLQFLSLLPYNVLTREEVIRIYYKFNDIDWSSDDSYGLYSAKLKHPFWELYSAGFLGVVVSEPNSPRKIQQFKQPHDQICNSQAGLPEAAFYLIHPALDGYIRKRRVSGVYNVFQHITVGHDCEWKPFYPTMCRVERYLFEVSDRELRDLTYHVLNEVDDLLCLGKHCGLPILLESSETWRTLNDLLPKSDHEDLHYELLELVS